MNGLKRVIQSEPALIIGFVNAILALIVLFGIPITEEQSAGIIVLVNILLGIATRAMVTPVAKVNQQVDAAVETALTNEAEPLTPEQREVINDLRAIRDHLRAKERQGQL